VLCLAGAVLGGIGAWAFAASARLRSEEQARDEEGPGNNWLVRLVCKKRLACLGLGGVADSGTPALQVGLALVTASCAGCMLLPALIIIPAHLWRYVPCHLNARSALSLPAEDTQTVEVSFLSRSIAIWRSHSKTADADAAPEPKTACSADLEQPVPLLSAAMGRPHVPSLLAAVARSGAEHREIGVIAAGTDAVCSACHGSAVP
jgi:hypothetical protein